MLTYADILDEQTRRNLAYYGIQVRSPESHALITAGHTEKPKKRKPVKMAKYEDSDWDKTGRLER